MARVRKLLSLSTDVAALLAEQPNASAYVDRIVRADAKRAARRGRGPLVEGYAATGDAGGRIVPHKARAT